MVIKMLNPEKRLLIKQAVKLTALGLTVEKKRGKLRKLVKRGIPYDDPRMLRALKNFNKADSEWKRIEAEQIDLRKKLGIM